jgi:hypothetical protein
MKFPLPVSAVEFNAGPVSAAPTPINFMGSFCEVQIKVS